MKRSCSNCSGSLLKIGLLDTVRFSQLAVLSIGIKVNMFVVKLALAWILNLERSSVLEKFDPK